MDWGFVWLMVVLKVPVALLLWLVWWAIRQPPEEAGDRHDGDGGSKVHRPRDPRGGRRPRPRGPHGEPAPPAPPRTRVEVVRPRTRAR